MDKYLIFPRIQFQFHLHYDVSFAIFKEYGYETTNRKANNGDIKEKKHKNDISILNCKLHEFTSN